MAQSEFSIIKHYFEQLTVERDDVVLAIGDDCALLQTPPEQVLAVSIDTLVEGVHFFADVCPEKLGYKSLAVSLSDLASMGAKPAWITLALTLPDVNQDWLEGFSHGIARLANQYDVQLIGGDTTRGPLTISIQAHGFVKPELALQRNRAKVGDLIYVTGTLGDAGAGLKLKLMQLDNLRLTNDDFNFLLARLEQPTPRVEAGMLLAGIANSAIDISDGLLSDLGHIIERSNVGASIDISLLPLSSSLQKLPTALAYDYALTAGDDYELCFTVAPEHIQYVSTLLAGQCTQIGVITEQSGINLYDDQGEPFILKKTGYDHFSH